MKTLREILFQKHQAVGPKLDALRKMVVASLAKPSRVNQPAVVDRRYQWTDFLFSLRWHLAGIGAAWVVIALLNLNLGRSTSLVSTMPATKIPPPQIILASLRENRKELLELMQPAESREVRPPKFVPGQPRSERPYASQAV